MNHVFTGDHTNITCLSEWKASWYHNDNEIIDDSQHYAISYNTLHIESVSQNHSGYYECRGINILNEKFAASMQLIISGKLN